MKLCKITKVDNGFILFNLGLVRQRFVFENLESLLTFLIKEYSDKKEKENDQSATKKM